MSVLSVLVSALALAVPALRVAAAPPAPTPSDEAQANTQGEADSPETLPWKPGPAALEIGHGVQLQLPADYQFLGQPEAGQLMTKLGNLYNDNLLGVVVPSSGDVDYFITMRYDEEGFIKDDENLDGDEILASIREGEEDYNAERKKAGFPAIHAEGWQEKPHYEKSKHQVIWGLTLSSADAPEDHSVNYNTRVLGRKGYVSVNLVTDVANLAAHKPAASAILAGTSFISGQRYDDFDPKSDKVAEYGLTGLVLGGAGLGVAKLAKVGLLAKFSKVLLAALLAGKKLIVGLLLAGAALARKLFGRRGGGEEQA